MQIGYADWGKVAFSLDLINLHTFTWCLHICICFFHVEWSRVCPLKWSVSGLPVQDTDSSLRIRFCEWKWPWLHIYDCMGWIPFMSVCWCFISLGAKCVWHTVSFRLNFWWSLSELYCIGSSCLQHLFCNHKCVNLQIKSSSNMSSSPRKQSLEDNKKAKYDKYHLLIAWLHICKYKYYGSSKKNCHKYTFFLPVLFSWLNNSVSGMLEFRKKNSHYSSPELKGTS